MKKFIAMLFLALFCASSVLAETSVDPAAAKSAFDLYKTLDGKWSGKSTKGWTEQMTFRTIAGGSVVVEDSFNAHPNESMLTTVVLDNDRVLLIHYCVAGNQPRLQLTSYDEQKKTLVFTYLDGTNLPSRDKGHMDKVVMQFVDEDHATAHWTWYQDGRERWMEKIDLERLK
jgi:hypothetical protein